MNANDNSSNNKKKQINKKSRNEDSNSICIMVWQNFGLHPLSSRFKHMLRVPLIFQGFNQVLIPRDL